MVPGYPFICSRTVCPMETNIVFVDYICRARQLFIQLTKCVTHNYFSN